MDHDRFDELKDAFVLGALPEGERREVEEYLAAHPERQAEIDELDAVAGLLALSPLEQEPPPELRQSIMHAVEGEAERPGPQPETRRTWFRELLGVRNVALGAAALLIIGLFSWNVLLQGEIQDMQEQAQRPEPPRDSQLVELEGTGPEARQAKAQVMIYAENRAVLMAEDMPPVPEDKTCQIWVIEGDVAKPSGLFEPGEGPVAVIVENPVSGADAIAVSLEPDGGSTQPTTDPMLVARL